MTTAVTEQAINELGGRNGIATSQSTKRLDERAKGQVFGTYTMHTIHSDLAEDPMQGPYLYVPERKGTVQMTFPLVSIRDQVFVDEPGKSLGQGREFLRKNGFSAFYHESSLKDLSSLKTSDTIRSKYYEEVEELVRWVTGCKKVFVTSSVTRTSQGEETKITNDRPKRDKIDHGKHEEAGKKMQQPDNIKPHHLPAIISPSRIPHMDYTPSGAQKLIRYMRSDICDYAQKAGAFLLEATIDGSDSRERSSTLESSEGVVPEYDGACGLKTPRYAVFSIWRPFKTCTRDPIAFTPLSELEALCSVEDPDLELWTYDLRAPGFKGDWLWNLAMIRGKKASWGDCGTPKTLPGPKWYYLPEQQPHEVLFIKHFDSASHGVTATESPGVPHGSPDLGDLAYGEPRESIELRVVVFW